MKKTILTLTALLPIVCSAQKDPCSSVKITYDEFKKTTKYEAHPSKGSFSIELERLEKEDEHADRMTVSFPVAYSDYRIKDAFIKFEDDSILQNKEISAESSYISGGRYYCICVFLLDDDIKDKMKKQKIKKFRIGSFDQDMPEKQSEKTMLISNCIFKEGD